MKAKISDKNWAVVMGRINNFFKKDVKIDRGMRNVFVEDEYVFDDDGRCICTLPKFEMKRVLESYSGRCKKHHVYEEILKNKDYFTGLRLMIDTPYSSTCIPIEIGDFVEFHGNRIIVKKHDISSKYYSTVEFIQMENTKEDVAKEIEQGVLDSLMWFLDDTLWVDYIVDNFGLNMYGSIIQAEQEIKDLLSDFIGDLDFGNISGVISKEFDCDNFDSFILNDNVKFTFSINIDKLKAEDKNEMFKITVDGEEVDFYALIGKLFEEQFEEEGE